MEADRKACLEAGMNDYVAKPIDRRHLLAAIDRCFRRTADELRTEADAQQSNREEQAQPASPAEPTVPPLIDRDIVDDLWETLGAGPFKALFERFRDGLSGRMLDLQTLSGAADLTDLLKASHSLRGAALSLGFSRLGQALLQMERQAKAGQEIAGALADALRIAKDSIEEAARTVS
jgi:HPt (histidine-containing phosphotransfer) domain-containing protein